MSKIKETIQNVNKSGEKALTIFLTAGYPRIDDFTELVFRVEKAGADIIEIGLPFGDSLADGPIVQSSYLKALQSNVDINVTMELVQKIRQKSTIPIIIMSSSNPINKFGKNKFTDLALSNGVNGLIIPDVPLEEFDEFFNNQFEGLDKILLTTPTSSSKRIREIDKRSSGFVYCVSVAGTTGIRDKFDDYVFENLKRTYSAVEENKMQIGFGISSPNDVKQFSPYCDGVIVGSAVINSLTNDDEKFSKTIQLVKDLKGGCKP